MANISEKKPTNVVAISSYRKTNSIKYVSYAALVLSIISLLKSFNIF